MGHHGQRRRYGGADSVDRVHLPYMLNSVLTRLGGLLVGHSKVWLNWKRAFRARVGHIGSEVTIAIRSVMA